MNSKNIHPESSKFKLIDELDMVPGNVSFLASKPLMALDKSTIGLKWNKNNQHLLIENYLKASYYEDYVMSSTCSKSIQDLQKKQVSRLCDYFNKDGKNILSLIEIGCGDGSFLNHAKKMISNCVGIEPSKSFARLARENGHKVIDGYVNSNDKLTADTFDSFVSRQVFEHVDDPLDVLEGIKKMLNPGAIGLIEVPNGYKAMRKKRFYEFFPDHVNYYSVNSLVLLANEAGFNVINCCETFGGDYLELWVRNEADQVESYLKEMVLERDFFKNQFINLLNIENNNNNKIGVWGCGAKTQSIFALLDGLINDISLVIVDSDINKHNKFLPNSNIQIVSPEKAIEMNLDVIVILALSYIDEIASIIRKSFNNTKILTFDHSGTMKFIEM